MTALTILLFSAVLQASPQTNPQIDQECKRQQTQLEQMQNQLRQEIGRVRELIEKNQEQKAAGVERRIRVAVAIELRLANRPASADQC